MSVLRLKDGLSRPTSSAPCSELLTIPDCDPQSSTNQPDAERTNLNMDDALQRLRRFREDCVTFIKQQDSTPERVSELLKTNEKFLSENCCRSE
jgi:hypothetical protein